MSQRGVADSFHMAPCPHAHAAWNTLERTSQPRLGEPALYMTCVARFECLERVYFRGVYRMVCYECVCPPPSPPVCAVWTHRTYRSHVVVWSIVPYRTAYSKACSCVSPRMNFTVVRSLQYRGRDRFFGWHLRGGDTKPTSPPPPSTHSRLYKTSTVYLSRHH